MYFPQISMIRIFTFLIACVIFIGSCSDRRKDNPFDPEGTQPVGLEITGFENHILLSWNSPDVDGYSGFNLYRSESGESNSFTILASSIPSDQRSYRDTDIKQGGRYHYYITIVGQGVESKPSAVVSSVPGPGYNWIVDGSGFEILKFSYDMQTSLLRFYTSMRPEDMAVSKAKNRGLILFPYFGIIHEINLVDGKIGTIIEGIAHPYAIEFDQQSGLFWVVDSSGFLYRIDDSDLVPQLISDVFSKPISITLAPQAGFLYISDISAQKVFQLNRDGTIINTISEINGSRLDIPIKFIHDEIYDRYWLLESTGSMTYIYTKSTDDAHYSKIEIPVRVSDMEISTTEESVYLAEINGINSSVLQLYPDGSRQIAVTGFYNPLDIEVNKYDASLIISDTGNGVIWHYDQEAWFIGRFTNLYLPGKATVE